MTDVTIFAGHKSKRHIDTTAPDQHKEIDDDLYCLRNSISFQALIGASAGIIILLVVIIVVICVICHKRKRECSVQDRRSINFGLLQFNRNK